MSTKEEFQDLIWGFYAAKGRELPWRTYISPYGVLVSEVMLQQTQVNRVKGRWERWLERFGSFEKLAEARVADVLGEWHGLGYNRRAVWLKKAAQQVVIHYGGVLPADQDLLVRLPGVGENTAGSVAAFAYNLPAVFIETNIRRVFLHEFFPDAQGVPDSDLKMLVESTLDRERPREWYWALMDYGANLAKVVPNPNRRSKNYVVQDKFEGSRRQLRGAVLSQLLSGPKSLPELGSRDPRLDEVLQTLCREGLAIEVAGLYRLP